ncbi:MAG: MFS transporter [Candidatus Eisenbacteria bacterium]|uniref:ADP,ATP carrier protein n=1 Tax=Eiseniibacteriota bacterium TaxID=2212470 RepID=A0A956M1Y2_UNCEI|nr:MFS transporter [Candidatus Eisenbacteria bacterium]
MNTTTSQPADPRREKSGLEAFLGLFAEVRRGEAGTALLLTANVFLILAAYYVIKPVREALILATGGAEVKAYTSALQTVLLLGAVPLYAKLASRFPRRRLINVVTLFFIGCLVAFFLMAKVGLRLQIPMLLSPFSNPHFGFVPLSLGVLFYLWVGIFNVMVVAQFWSFANDLYTPDQGKRLFAIVGFGASAGAVAGPFISAGLIDSLGPYPLLLVAGAILVLSLFLTNVVDSRERSVSSGRAADTSTSTQPSKEEPIGKEGAYKLVFSSRYLLLIALLILFLNWVNSTGEYILGRVVTQEATQLAAQGVDKGTFIGKFYSDFFGVVNLVGLVVQLFFVSRILKYWGVRVALLIMPVIALLGYSLVAFVPILALIRWVKTAENATDYSLQNTLRGVLFLPTTREQKYKAKQAIDTIFVRGGDALSALLVFVGTQFLAFQTREFALVNMAFVGIWILLAIAVGIRYRSLTQKA